MGEWARIPLCPLRTQPLRRTWGEDTGVVGERPGDHLPEEPAAAHTELILPELAGTPPPSPGGYFLPPWGGNLPGCLKWAEDEGYS